ncbi:hypothetical protein ACLB2K_012814 [Fragaria x ananassa]
MDQFLERCFYHSDQCDSQDQFAQLDKKLKEHEGGRIPDHLFYLFIPPNIFIDVVCCASLSASSGNGWTSVIVEKPLGRDSESSAALTKSPRPDSELSAGDSTSPITEQISSPQDSLNIASDSNQNLHLTLDASWCQAMNEEFTALQQNDTWELVPYNPSMNILPNKWIFKIKKKADGTVECYKARLVANGFHQKEGIPRVFV